GRRGWWRFALAPGRASRMIRGARAPSRSPLRGHLFREGIRRHAWPAFGCDAPGVPADALGRGLPAWVRQLGPAELPRGLRGAGVAGDPRIGHLVVADDRRPALAGEAPPALVAVRRAGALCRPGGTGR